MGSYYESPEYISHNSKKRDLFSLVYKGVRKYTIRGKYSIVKTHSKGDRLLDIGCGTGEFLSFCSQKGYKVEGVEPGAKARDFAKQQNKLEIHEDLDSILNRGLTFDCITMWHVLEHIPNLSESIVKIKRLLSQTGVLLIAVPNCKSWDAMFYKDYWAAYDLPRHLYHFDKKTLSLLMGKHKLHIQKIIPQILDSFYVSILSEKYLKGRQRYLHAIINGAKSNYHAMTSDDGYSSLIFIVSR